MRNGLNQNIEIFLFHIKVSDFQSSWLKLETKSIFQKIILPSKLSENRKKHFLSLTALSQNVSLSV